MARPRILLVPTMTEVEWKIKPLLEEWAEVASFDTPGVGKEPAHGFPGPDAIIARGVDEIERRGWDSCVVVGDEAGAAQAVQVSARRPAVTRAWSSATPPSPSIVKGPAVRSTETCSTR